MRRFVSIQLACLSIAIVLGAARSVRAEVLVAPRVHAVGVDRQTAETFGLLLVREIETRMDGRLLRSDEGRARPCVDPTCAGRRARRLGADGALLADLARLGDDYIATLRVVDRAGKLVWSEERTARVVEDLDRTAAELAAARFGGEVRIEASAELGAEPPPSGQERIRRGWSAQGPRVGTFGPLGDAYAGSGSMMSLAYVWRYQTTAFNVEVIPALGVTWGGDVGDEGGRARDWSLLDLFVGWMPVPGDVSPYVGGGLGLHAIELERAVAGTSGTQKDGEAGIALSLGCGLLLFRTYDFQLSLDLRYQHFLHDFQTVSGGARGLGFSFGIQHR